MPCACRIHTQFAGEGVASAMIGGADGGEMPERNALHPSASSGKPPLGGSREPPPAGGRASNANACPDGVGHTRGNLHGADFLQRVSLAEQRDVEQSMAAGNGVLSRRAGGASGQHQTTVGNLKGHGVCNPLVEYVPSAREATGGTQCMPTMGGRHAHAGYPGAAGAASSENWRSTHNYMANGAESYGDFRSEHLALQPHAKARARNLQPASKVVFGDGLWKG